MKIPQCSAGDSIIALVKFHENRLLIYWEIAEKQLRKWELSNEVEKKTMASFIHGIEIISNKLLNFMFTSVNNILNTFIIDF